MTPGMYSAVSGLNARWTQQERIADNIGAASSIGNKRQIAAFGVFQQALRSAQGGVQPAGLTYAQPSSIDWSPGPLQKTDQPFDAAISGSGFFSVQTSAGVRLTRNGHFHLNEKNQLINDAGFSVLGQRGPITLPKGKAELSANGTLSVNGKVIDQLQILDLPKEQLKALGGSLFSFGDAKPQAVKEPQLAVGALESSNVELPKEMVGMIQNQRMYDLLTRAFQTQDEGLAKAIQDLSAS